MCYSVIVRQRDKIYKKLQSLYMPVTSEHTSDLTECVSISCFLLAKLFPPIQPYQLVRAKQTRAHRSSGACEDGVWPRSLASLLAPSKWNQCKMPRQQNETAAIGICAEGLRVQCKQSLNVCGAAFCLKHSNTYWRHTSEAKDAC